MAGLLTGFLFFYGGNPLTFEEWLQAVDQVVGNIAFGLSVFDTSRYSVQALPDIDFPSLYEAGETAQRAAEEALLQADFPFDIFDFEAFNPGGEFDEETDLFYELDD